MRINKTLMAAAGVAAAAWTPAQAFEAGSAGFAQQPGVTLGGVSAEGPPPGLYMVDQAYTFQGTLQGRALTPLIRTAQKLESGLQLG